MELRRKIGHRAQRTGFYAESKFSNWTKYGPAHSEAHRVLKMFEKDLEKNDGILVKSVPVNSPSLFMPVSEQDVIETLSEIPRHFLRGLKAVFLLGGSRRQLKSSDRSFFYGSYAWGYIWLYPFPFSRMMETWSRLPKPSVRREYERVGVVWQPVQGGWLRMFSQEALRKFYLRDVLIHEIGHHIDRFTKRDHRSSEAFAHWIASSVGFGK